MKMLTGGKGTEIVCVCVCVCVCVREALKNWCSQGEDRKIWL